MKTLRTLLVLILLCVALFSCGDNSVINTGFDENSPQTDNEQETQVDMSIFVVTYAYVYPPGNIDAVPTFYGEVQFFEFGYRNYEFSTPPYAWDGEDGYHYVTDHYELIYSTSWRNPQFGSNARWIVKRSGNVLYDIYYDFSGPGGTYSNIINPAELEPETTYQLTMSYGYGAK